MIARVPLVATDDDVMRISAENPGWRIERDATGAPLMTPPTGAATSNRNVRLAAMLFKWAEANGCVAFDSNGGFRLSDTSIVSPDGSLVSDEAWSKLTPKEREGFFPGAPLVAIELCSHSDSPLELRKKLVRLRREGSFYVVLIDPYHRVVWTDGTPPPDFDLDFDELLN